MESKMQGGGTVRRSLRFQDARQNWKLQSGISPTHRRVLLVEILAASGFLNGSIIVLLQQEELARLQKKHQA